MKKLMVAWTCAAAVFCTPQAGVAGGNLSSDNLSTGLALGLLGSAIALTFEHSDKTGGIEFAKTFGSTILVTETLKAVVNERRPDGSGNDSFPSGHTAAAFAAATYLSIRYKDSIGVYSPLLFGAAALTGISRVRANKHYTKDVVAGAVIGAGLAFVFTSPFSKGLAIYPSGNGVGASYSLKF